jgi:ribulose-bisphosphate carboxylase large chain
MLKAIYELKSPQLEKAAHALAVGQSVGNPYIRNSRESPELVKKHGATVESIVGNRVTVGFPAVNFGPRDGIAYLMSVLMGGQMDIDLIESCRLLDIEFGPLLQRFPGPRFGLDQIRKMTGARDRPLIGGIVKPKIGLTPEQLAEVCYEMADGGLDFIKEDEILGDPPWCPLKKRVPAVAEALKRFKTLYAPCITADGDEVIRRAKLVKSLGATAVHVNLWAGLGSYLKIREKVDIPIFFQKSGDKLLTTGAFSMEFSLLCKLIRLIGCDFTHVGMWGGYMSESEAELLERLQALQGPWCEFPKVIPSFSCGAHPGMVQALVKRFGKDIMVSAGGAIHGHPMGTRAGAKAFRQAIVNRTPVPAELAAAISEWGMVS